MQSRSQHCGDNAVAEADEFKLLILPIVTTHAPHPLELNITFPSVFNYNPSLWHHRFSSSLCLGHFSFRGFFSSVLEKRVAFVSSGKDAHPRIMFSMSNKRFMHNVLCISRSCFPR